MALVHFESAVSTALSAKERTISLCKPTSSAPANCLLGSLFGIEFEPTFAARERRWQVDSKYGISISALKDPF